MSPRVIKTERATLPIEEGGDVSNELVELKLT